MTRSEFLKYVKCHGYKADKNINKRNKNEYKLSHNKKTSWII